jgi:DNA-binding MarR family transcriptional regulator
VKILILLSHYFLVDDSPDRHILASDLFMELASELRCSILVSLGKKPAKLSSLARELDTTVQDVHRNVSRLAEAGLVRRDDSLFRLTEYGRIVIKQILRACKQHSAGSRKAEEAGIRREKAAKNNYLAGMGGGGRHPY